MTYRLSRRFNSVALAAGLLMSLTAGVVAQTEDRPEEGVVSFKVLQPDGTPLANSSLLFGYEYREGRDGHTGSGSRPATTDAQGVTSAFSERLGIYTIFVHAPGAGSTMLENVKIPAQKQPVEIRLQRGGAPLHIEVREANAPGQVAGRPVGNARISMFRMLPGNFKYLMAAFEQTLDGTGAVDIANLLPGSYVVSANNPEYDVAAQAVNITEQNSVSAQLTLRRPELAAVELTVLNTDGAPVRNTEFLVATDDLIWTEKNREISTAVQMAQYLVANSRIGGRGYPYPKRRVKTNENGKALVYPVRTGRWRFRFFTSELQREYDWVAQSQDFELTNAEPTAVTVKLKPKATAKAQ